MIQKAIILPEATYKTLILFFKKLIEHFTDRRQDRKYYSRELKISSINRYIICVINSINMGITCLFYKLMFHNILGEKKRFHLWSEVTNILKEYVSKNYINPTYKSNEKFDFLKGRGRSHKVIQVLYVSCKILLAMPVWGSCTGKRSD